MKTIICPHCGAQITIDTSNAYVNCEYCGSSIEINADKTIETVHTSELKGSYVYNNQKDSTEPTKKGKITWWKILLWICFLPIMATVFIVKTDKLDNKKKGIAIAALWIICFIVGATNKSESTENVSNTAVADVKETKEKNDSLSEVEENSAINDSEDVQEEESNDNENVVPGVGIRNETLNGRGRSDSGREEPQYEGIIGYVVISNSQENNLERTDNFADESLWMIPTLTKDKQFTVESGQYLPHKTAVVVKKQDLKHEGYGSYSGTLVVETLDTNEEYTIGVSHFITKPYWTYDLLEAAKIGMFVAKYNQKSDYYPTTKGRDPKDAVRDLPEDTLVLVKGLTGTYGKNGPDNKTNQIEAIVWKEWTYGYGGVSVYFNVDDLKIVDLDISDENGASEVDEPEIELSGDYALPVWEVVHTNGGYITSFNDSEERDNGDLYVFVWFNIENDKDAVYAMAEQIKDLKFDRMVEIVPQDASGTLGGNMAIIDIEPNGQIITHYVHPNAGW